MQMDEPLAGPWAKAQRFCLWVIGGALVIRVANSLTADLDWVALATFVLTFASLVVLLPALVMGRLRLGRMENQRKEADRLRLLGH